MLTLPWFMDHILRPLRDPAWPIPILKDFSDVTLVGYDDKQNNAHKIILAWPDRSKMGWPALLGVVRAIQLEPVQTLQLGPAGRSGAWCFNETPRSGARSVGFQRNTTLRRPERGISVKHHAPAPGAWDFSETPRSSGRSVDFSEMLSPMAAAPAEFRIYGFHSDIGFHLGRGTMDQTTIWISFNLYSYLLAYSVALYLFYIIDLRKICISNQLSL